MRAYCRCMTPTRSYLVWFSQRVGSTLLAHTLEDTGIAGRPREWLNAPNVAELLARSSAKTAFELRDSLWRQATTDNGVMATKYGMHEGLHAELTSFLAPLAHGSDTHGRAQWEALYPSCKHVFVTRRNKIRLAVSWWRAIKSGEWHRAKRASSTAQKSPPVSDLIDRYDYNAIEHLFTEASLREADMQEVFDRWGVVPHTVVYEDMIDAYEPTVRGVLDFLDLAGPGVEIAAPAFEQLADDVSEAWFRRFRAERAARLQAAAR